MQGLVLSVCLFCFIVSCFAMDDSTKQLVYFTVPAFTSILSALILLGFVGYHLAQEIGKSRSKKQYVVEEFEGIN